VRSVPVVGGLEHPWAVAWLPDGDLLITERPGRLRLVRGGVLQPEPIRGVPEVLAAGQGGLLDVAVHPDFATNRWIYLTYAAGSAASNHTRLARARFDGRALSQLEVIYAVPQRKSGTQHFGSRLLWLPDETLLLAIGDGGYRPIESSIGLPGLSAARIDAFLARRFERGETALITEFRETVAAGLDT